MSGTGHPLDNAEIGLGEGVERRQPPVKRPATVLLHPVGVNGERLLVLHPQRHRRHRVGLQFRQAEVEIVAPLDDLVVQAAGDAGAGAVAQANLDRGPFVQIDRLGPVVSADVHITGDLEHQAREIAASATLHHRQTSVAMIVQVGQERFEDGGVGVRMGGEVDAVGLDVDGATVPGNHSPDAAVWGLHPHPHPFPSQGRETMIRVRLPSPLWEGAGEEARPPPHTGEGPGERSNLSSETLDLRHLHRRGADKGAHLPDARPGPAGRQAGAD